MRIERFEDIDAWKRARELNQLTRHAARAGAFAADPVLGRQMRKASTSVMANIAEGFDSGSDPEFIRFLKIARRSASEVQSHLYAALDDNYIPQARFDEIYSKAAETKRLIGGFMRYLGFKPPKAAAKP